MTAPRPQAVTDATPLATHVHSLTASPCPQAGQLLAAFATWLEQRAAAYAARGDRAATAGHHRGAATEWHYAEAALDLAREVRAGGGKEVPDVG